jgi:RNA polymerase sigma factor (sigma-70 family)
MSAEASARRVASIYELELVYRQNYPRLLRVAVALLGDVERARDAVHEAFVRAIKSAGDFRAEGSLEAWVWRTLVNVCLVEKRHQARLREYPPEPASHTQPVDWPEVRAAIAALPQRQRTTLFLRHYADLDYDQIALVLGVARGTVAASLHAAHSKLRAALSGEVKR